MGIKQRVICMKYEGCDICHGKYGSRIGVRIYLGLSFNFSSV
jgi:hypothetical protein